MVRRGGEALDAEEEKPIIPTPPAPAFTDVLRQETNTNNNANTTTAAVVSLFSNKNFWIAMLVVLLVLSFLGVNFVLLFGQIVQPIVNVFWILVSQILGLFGYTTGTVLNKTVDVVSNTAKAGIDIAEGTVQSVGNLLIKGSSSDVNANTQAEITSNILGNASPSPSPSLSTLDAVLNRPNVKQVKEPRPDDAATSAIQSSSSLWCLVGEIDGTRTCADVSGNNLCYSGKYYQTEAHCKEGFAINKNNNGPLMMATPVPPQVAPTGAAVVQLPVLQPPQYMGPPNFPPPGMTTVQMTATTGPPLLGVGPPNYIPR